MLIGEVARRSGIAASALRYYEREGLLQPPARSSKRRIYSPQVMGRIRIIQFAREAGFTIAEIRTFINNYPTGAIPSVRWQKLADRKLQDIDALIGRAMRMKTLLRSGFKCSCLTIEDCERLVLDSDRTARQ